MSTNPKDAIGLTKPALRLVPPALALHVSQAMANGAKKYGPYNWREHPVRLTVYIEAALRHLYSLLDGEDHARDSGVLHAAHVGACMAIILDAMGTDSLIDDRATEGCASDLIEDLTLKPEDNATPAGETLDMTINVQTQGYVKQIEAEISEAVYEALTKQIGRRVLITPPPAGWNVDFAVDADGEVAPDTVPEPQHPVDAALDSLIASELDFVRAYPTTRPLKIGDVVKKGGHGGCATNFRELTEAWLVTDAWRVNGWTHEDGTPIEPIPVCGAV